MKSSLLDVELAAERNLARAGAGIFRIVDGVKFLDFALGIIGDDDLDRAQHGQPAQRRLVQLFADGVFEHGDVRQSTDIW